MKESVGGGRGLYNEDKGACPLHYQRMTYEDVRDRGQVPYLLGGRRQPHCRTCSSKAPWANFCSWDYAKFSGCVLSLCLGCLFAEPSAYVTPALLEVMCSFVVCMLWRTCVWALSN